MHPRQTIRSFGRGDVIAVALAGATFCMLMSGDSRAADFDRPTVIPRVLPTPAPNQQPANPNAPQGQQPANPNVQRGGPIRTRALMFSGTGAPLTVAPVAAGRTIRVGPLSFAGTGAPLTTPVRSGGPVSVRTGPLSFTGTGAM